MRYVLVLTLSSIAAGALIGPAVVLLLDGRILLGSVVLAGGLAVCAAGIAAIVRSFR